MNILDVRVELVLILWLGVYSDRQSRLARVQRLLDLPRRGMGGMGAPKPSIPIDRLQ